MEYKQNLKIVKLSTYGNNYIPDIGIFYVCWTINSMGLIMKGDDKMTVTFRDELGVISICDIDDIQFDGCKAYFTDENGTDFKVNIEHLISIIKER